MRVATKGIRMRILFRLLFHIKLHSFVAPSTQSPKFLRIQGRIHEFSKGGRATGTGTSVPQWGLKAKKDEARC